MRSTLSRSPSGSSDVFAKKTVTVHEAIPEREVLTRPSGSTSTFAKKKRVSMHVPLPEVQELRRTSTTALEGELMCRTQLVIFSF